MKDLCHQEMNVSRAMNIIYMYAVHIMYAYVLCAVCVCVCVCICACVCKGGGCTCVTLPWLGPALHAPPRLSTPPSRTHCRSNQPLRRKCHSNSWWECEHE